MGDRYTRVPMPLEGSYSIQHDSYTHVPKRLLKGPIVYNIIVPHVYLRLLLKGLTVYNMIVTHVYPRLFKGPTVFIMFVKHVHSKLLKNTTVNNIIVKHWYPRILGVRIYCEPST